MKKYLDKDGLLYLYNKISAKYITKEQLNEYAESTKDDWYGIMWTSENTTPVRIGNMNLHRSLPILSKMRRCMLSDDGSVYGYISKTDYTKFEDGRAVDYTDTAYQYMVEIPEYYYESYYYTENDTDIYILKLYPYSDHTTCSKKVYVSAVEAASNDSDSEATTKKLYSTCLAITTVTNSEVLASNVTYSNNATKYRGGARNSEYDNLENSLLGRPATNLTRAEFRTRAAVRGTGWSQLYWTAYMSVVRLYVVEYCSFNSQANFINTTDTNGYKQGGLGPGVSTLTDVQWSGYNSYNPFVPCGVTKTLCNATGIINYKITYSGDTISVQVPSYRGVENPFGHIWKWTDGINIYSNNNTTTVYTTDNISNFSDNTSTNYTNRVTFTTPSNGYIKTWNWDINGDFIPTSTGGSSNSYLYDYSWWNSNWRVLRSGGSASAGAYCGWFCFYAYYGSSYAVASFGGRLYYTPQN